MAGPWHGLLALLLLAFAGSAVALDASQPEVDLEPAFVVLRDPGGRLDEAGARAARAAGRFQPLPRERTQFGFTDDAIWLAVDLDNPGRETLSRTLVLGHPRLDQIDVYLRADGRSRHVALGDTLPFAARSRAIPQPNVDLTLTPGARVELLVRVHSTSSIQVPAALYDALALDSRYVIAVAADTFYFGLLFGLMLYNLALYFAIGERTYLWYVAYVACFGGLMLAYTGIGFQLLWPRSAGFANVAVPFFTAALLAASTWFQRLFLDLGRNAPRLDPWFAWGTYTMLALAAATFVLPTRPATIAANVGALAMSALAFASAIVCALRGFKPAVYFVLAWSVLIAGGICVPLKNFALIEPSLFTEYAVQIGSALEMILLAFALAYRINVMRAERDRLLREAQLMLEHRVDERTRELNHALAELEVANRHLHESSRRDGLTGVYNRRHLDDVLDDMVRRAQAHHLPLSLLMIDLDHFKAINDRRGHAAGDECLRAVAARIAAVIEERAEAFVVRYGGEEFAGVLPMTDGMAAAALAERLRQTIARVPIATVAGDVPVTISVGVATLTARDGDAATLLQRADQALYEAKHRGRDRVIAA